VPTQIKIKELAFVCHPVADIARARAFYGGFLGLKTGLEIEFAPGLWWIEYDVAGVALAVTNASPPSGPGASSVALEVADFDGTLAAVRAAGVALTIEPQDFSPCRMFAVNSPDGYTIMFHQRKA
jgi:catechol 2,3-dioxygenase-like lactoylglutathione lyase family enzyme